ncbi:DNA-3-methyladenine glycosylase family protein [Nakamurella endophytica]|uniref:DNA-3-methyladenine glycosylase family protein n=1 Tax=Nakamurella endophytica TaxID=1748367 RepID=UPI003570CF85
MSVDAVPSPCEVETVFRPAAPIDAVTTLSVLRRGAGDPCHRWADGGLWRTARLPSGPVSYLLRQRRDEIHCRAWGPGAAELAERLPRLLGADDRPDGFEPRVPLLAAAARRFAGVRIPRTGLVLESLVPAVIEQRVMGKDAFAAWRYLVTRFGDPAPGPAPAGMRVLPDAEGWRRVRSWDWHLANVDPGRARAVGAALRVADRLQQLADRHADEPGVVYRALTSLPGIGRWTAAQVGHRVLGDADALPVGDYHLGRMAGHALAGRILGDDEVETFLEPWRPHRYRVFRLLELAGAGPPRRGPRLAVQDHRHH